MLLGSVVGVAFWVKHRYPDSAATKLIDRSTDFACNTLQRLMPATSTTNCCATPKCHQTEAPCKPTNKSASLTPEDSVLKRHYQTHLQSEKQAITNPYPTDSVLIRHHESAVSQLLSAKNIDSANCQAEIAKLKMPEDSVLKRHFLSAVRREVESKLAPRPTDSVLSRHYDSYLQAKIDILLA